MVYQDTSSNKAYSLWQVQQIRHTCFLNQTDESAVSAWWQSIVGEPSEQKITLQKHKQYQETGSYFNGKLVLSTQLELDRVDWLYIPKESEFSIGSFKDVLDTFSELMFRWIESAPSFKRMALGLILYMPAKSKNDANYSISKLLPDIKIDIENSSDFLYQINRPRKTTTGIADLNINRLMKWSVALTKRVVLSSDGASRFYTGDYFAKLELDINTVADYKGLLPNKKTRLIYSEFVSLANEILTSGDKP